MHTGPTLGRLSGACSLRSARRRAAGRLRRVEAAQRARCQLAGHWLASPRACRPQTRRDFATKAPFRSLDSTDTPGAPKASSGLLTAGKRAAEAGRAQLYLRSAHAATRTVNIHATARKARDCATRHELWPRLGVTANAASKGSRDSEASHLEKCPPMHTELHGCAWPSRRTVRYNASFS